MNLREMPMRKPLAAGAFACGALTVIVTLIRWQPLPEGLFSLLSVMMGTFGGGYIATSSLEAVKKCGSTEKQ